VRKGFRAGLLAAGALLVLGCSARFETFGFQTAEGTRIDIRQSERRARDREAIFQPTADRSVSPVYTLEKPLAMTARGQAFSFSYTSSLPGCTLTVFSDGKKPLRSVKLPASSGTPLRFLLPVAEGERIWGFQLSAPAPAGAETGELEMRGAGTAPFVHGFAIEADELTVDGSLEVLSASPSRVTARIPARTRGEMEQGPWMISLVQPAESAGGRVVFTSAEGRTAAFDVGPMHAPARLDFARGSVGFLPTGIDFIGTLQEMAVSQLSRDAPIPADPGLILTWDQSAWRRPDFEVFSWDRFPKVLIFDTSSYEVQDGLFNRLAFFVEKAGHAGTIEAPRALSGIHGYNAHDYKADDLARFFSAAKDKEIPLTPEEGQLLNQLEANGIVTQSGSAFAAGDGSVIAISRSSSPLLRDLLLTHECFHGAFFSVPAFRDATEHEWGSLSEVEKEVWVRFLASRGYNTTDHYLLVNEFQSYLLQQERKNVQGFQTFTLSRLRAASSRDAALVKRLLAASPDSFLRSFDVLDEALQSAGGPPGGDAASVRLSH
jgi:hypothetical protein